MPNKWTDNEDRQLRRLVDCFEKETTINWVEVARRLPGRNNKDCRKRWTKISEQWRKGSWDDQENVRLRQAVEQVGTRWITVAEIVGTRSPDQCQKRWQNALNPGLSAAEWTPADDDHLKSAVAAHGRNWSFISKHFFPNRSPLSLSNRFTSIASQPDNQIDASQCYPSPAASTIMATSLAGDHCHLGFDASQTPAGSNYPSTNYTYNSGLSHAHALSSHDAFAADYPPLSEYEPHGPAGVVDLKLEASHADDHAQFYGSWGGSEFTSPVSEAPAFPFGPYMDSVGAAGAPPYTYTLEHIPGAGGGQHWS